MQGTSIALLNAAEKAIHAYHNACVRNGETVITAKEEDTIHRYRARADRLIKLVSESSWEFARELRELRDCDAQTVGDRGVW